MRKTLTLLGVLALVLGLTAGATAGAQAVLAPSSIDGKMVKDRSLHFVDFSANVSIGIQRQSGRALNAVHGGWLLGNFDKFASLRGDEQSVVRLQLSG